MPPAWLANVPIGGKSIPVPVNSVRKLNGFNVNKFTASVFSFRIAVAVACVSLQVKFQFLPDLRFLRWRFQGG